MSHQYLVRATLTKEHANIRESLSRIETLLTEDLRSLQHHERHLWALERDTKDREIADLRRYIDLVEEENRKVNARVASLQRQHNQPRSVVHHTDLPVNERPPIVYNAPLPDNLLRLNSGIPRSLSDQPVGSSSTEAGIYDLPPSLYGEYTPMSPEIGQFDNFEFSQVFAQNPAGAASPEYSPPSPSLMMMMSNSLSDSSRSPKRPASAIDDSEAILGVEGVAPRASAAQGSISAPAPLQEASSPPIKRQRSMSHDYYVVTGVKSEPEADEGELQRLTMHAGHTPNRSVSSPSAIVVAATATATAGPSRGGITPTASSLLGVEGNTNTRPNTNANERIKTELEPKVEAEVDVEVKTEEVKMEEVKAEETSTAEIDSSFESIIRNMPPTQQRSRHMTIPEITEEFRSQVDETFRRQSRRSGQSSTPPTNPDSSVVASPASQRALLNATDDNTLSGPLMIRNIPEQDELFMEVLNERLEPISQGQNALPKVVQDLRLSPVPDDTERVEAQSDAGEEADGVLIRREPKSLPRLSGAEHVGEDEDAPVEIVRPVRREEPGSDSESGPEVTLKLKHTSNFGAPFGRM